MQKRLLLTCLSVFFLASCSSPKYQSGHWPGGNALVIPLDPIQIKGNDWAGAIKYNSKYSNPNSQIEPEIAQVSWTQHRAFRDTSSTMGAFYGYGFDLSNSGLNARYSTGLVWEREKYDVGLAGQFRAFLTYDYTEKGWTPELCIGIGCSGVGSEYLIDRPVQWGWGVHWEPYFRYRFLSNHALVVGYDGWISFIGSSIGGERGKSMIYQNGPWAFGVRKSTLYRSIEGEQRIWTGLVQYRTHIQTDSLGWLNKINRLRARSVRFQNEPEAMQNGFWSCFMADLAWGGVSWERRHQGLPTQDSLQGYDTESGWSSTQDRFAVIPGIRIGTRTKWGLGAWIEWSKYLGTSYGTKNRLIDKPLDYSESAFAIASGWIGDHNLFGIKAYLGYQDWDLYSAELTGFGMEYYRRISTWQSWRIGIGGGLSLVNGRSYSGFDFHSNEWRLLAGIRMW